MAIKNLTVNTDRSVTLIDDMGNFISMSSALVGVLKEQLAKLDVRNEIRYAIEDCDGDTIALGSFDGTIEDFIEEVYSTFENDIECGNYPTEEEIEEAVLDTADSYGILID